MDSIDNIKQGRKKGRVSKSPLQRHATQADDHEMGPLEELGAVDMVANQRVVTIDLLETGEITFSEVYRMQPLERIDMIRTGLEPSFLAEIAQAMDRTRESVAKLMGLSLSTVERKQKKHELLSPEQSERLMGTLKLIGQVQAMVEESGNPEGFDAAQWFGQWVDRPLAALGGRQPAELMDTAEGREMVSRLLAAAQSGAYA